MQFKSSFQLYGGFKDQKKEKRVNKCKGKKTLGYWQMNFAQIFKSQQIKPLFFFLNEMSPPRTLG